MLRRSLLTYLRRHAGLGRETFPAKQYRLQLHVANNGWSQHRPSMCAPHSAGSMVDAVSSTEYFDVVDRITIDPNQCGGRPCIRGMRIRVKDLLDMLAEGATEQEILNDYPDLEAEDIRASLAYAARYFDHPVLVNS